MFQLSTQEGQFTIFRNEPHAEYAVALMKVKHTSLAIKTRSGDATGYIFAAGTEVSANLYC